MLVSGSTVAQTLAIGDDAVTDTYENMFMKNWNASTWYTTRIWMRSKRVRTSLHMERRSTRSSTTNHAEAAVSRETQRRWP